MILRAGKREGGLLPNIQSQAFYIVWGGGGGGGGGRGGGGGEGGGGSKASLLFETVATSWDISFGSSPYFSGHPYLKSSS